MKTAEEVLYKMGPTWVSDHERVISILDAIEAMKFYAKQMIEEDRKDCAEKAGAMLKGLVSSGIVVAFESSILNRPYPTLK